jgi:hypothetical protein
MLLFSNVLTPWVAPSLLFFSYFRVGQCGVTDVTPAGEMRHSIQVYSRPELGVRGGNTRCGSQREVIDVNRQARHS